MIERIDPMSCVEASKVQFSVTGLVADRLIEFVFGGLSEEPSAILSVSGRLG